MHNEQKKLFKKLEDIYQEYTINGSTDLASISESRKKEMQEIFVRNENVADNFELDKYSEFTIKDNFLNKMCSFFLRKKL